MQRTKVILFPPTGAQPHQRELAMGMQSVWACALYAAGANVFAPLRLLEPDDDPFASLAGTPGASLMHDGAPLDASVDVIVVAELRCETDGWRCRARLLRADGEIVLPGRVHRDVSGVLDVMTATLHAIADALDLALPEYVGWRQLLRARTVPRAIEALRVQGRRALRQSDLEPAAAVH